MTVHPSTIFGIVFWIVTAHLLHCQAASPCRTPPSSPEWSGPHSSWQSEGETSFLLGDLHRQPSFEEANFKEIQEYLKQKGVAERASPDGEVMSSIDPESLSKHTSAGTGSLPFDHSCKYLDVHSNIAAFHHGDHASSSRQVEPYHDFLAMFESNSLSANGQTFPVGQVDPILSRTVVHSSSSEDKSLLPSPTMQDGEKWRQHLGKYLVNTQHKIDNLPETRRKSHPNQSNLYLPPNILQEIRGRRPLPSTDKTSWKYGLSPQNIRTVYQTYIRLTGVLHDSAVKRLAKFCKPQLALALLSDDLQLQKDAIEVIGIPKQKPKGLREEYLGTEKKAITKRVADRLGMSPNTATSMLGKRLNESIARKLKSETTFEEGIQELLKNTHPK